MPVAAMIALLAFTTSSTNFGMHVPQEGEDTGASCPSNSAFCPRRTRMQIRSIAEGLHRVGLFRHLEVERVAHRRSPAGWSCEGSYRARGSAAKSMPLRY
jgi:hypothetical protein